MLLYLISEVSKLRKMKPIILGLFIVIALYSCKLNKKIKPEGPHYFDATETPMAELKAEPQPEIEVSKKDTIEFLKFWEQFYKSYKENDIKTLTRLSYDSVNSPVFIEKQNRFQKESAYISINDFLKANIWNDPPITPSFYSNSDRIFIHYRYKYNQDTIKKKSKNDSVLLAYHVLVESNEIKGNYEFRKLFSLSFSRKNNGIRFSGMEINGESYPRLVNDSTTRSKLYFPLYGKTQDPGKNLNTLDTFTNLWYSAVLSEFKEPNLYTYSGEDDVYRFTWLRSFQAPVVIRFQKYENEYLLTTKVMKDNQGYIPNEFVVNTSQNLSAAKWKNFELRLGRINFWKIPTLDPEPAAMDGAQWIMEARVNGRYHFVDRQFDLSGFKECCKILLGLSKLKIAEEDIY